MNHNNKPKAYSYLRFSTPEQMKGDSFRRQTQSAVQYAQKRGLELDDRLTFQDLGMSAFHGDNVHQGALGAFLKAVRDGRIQSGSYLLVESLDRLSRQDVLSAFTQFTNIIKLGINIATLQDGNTYSLEQGELAFSGLITSIVIMQRAHEESLTKSKRLQEAWKGKREQAQSGNGRKLTSWAPGWLKLSDDRTAFHILEDRAEIVRRIFQETIDGIGQEAIARKLNQEGVPTFNGNPRSGARIPRGRPSHGWQATYIRRILTNEATIGIFQPHKRIRQQSGRYKRVPDGDPIEGYYPKVIEPETFYRVKEIRSKRIIPGRNSAKRLANLFTGLAVCGACGAKMYYENKGRKSRELSGFGCGDYLVCSNARRKIRLEDGAFCKAHRWKYPQLQCHIVMNLLELDFRELFPRVYQASNEALKQLEGALLEAGGELERVDTGIERVMDAIVDAGKSPALLNRLKELEERKEELTQKLDSLEDQLIQERNRGTTIGKDHQDTSEALERLLQVAETGSPEEILDSRRRLHQLLQKVIDRIEFIPAEKGEWHADPDFNRGKPLPIHGTILIHFKGAQGNQGLGGYHREIYVKAGKKTDPEAQRESWGYKVEYVEGKRPVYTLHVAVDDGEWPPSGRLITGSGLWNDVAGEYLK